MKKYLIAFLILLLASTSFAGFEVGGVSAPATIDGSTYSYADGVAACISKETFDSTNGSVQNIWKQAASGEKFASIGFLTTSEFTLCKVSLELCEVGAVSDSSTWRLQLRSHDAAPDEPEDDGVGGNPLDTSDTILGSAISSCASYSSHDFNFTGGVTLSNATRYHFVIECTSNCPALDNTNYIRYEYNSTDPSGYTNYVQYTAVASGNQPWNDHDKTAEIQGFTVYGY